MSIEEHRPVQELLLPRQQFGRYEIVGLLGYGGFAAVYEALDPALDATVAVKVLGDNHCVDPEVRARFIKEARLLRRIGSDRLVPVFDIGEQGGQPFFVMELIGGGTLAERFVQRVSGSGSVDRVTVRRIISELAACLDVVHRAGIVHRDLKPSNILIRRPGGRAVVAHSTQLLADDEQLVLGDFGIARELDASNLTMAVGTVGYMAPEQKTPSATIDQRADIYAATAIIAMLLTSPETAAAPGRPSETPADLHARMTGLSPELRAALVRGLATDPDDRPSTAAEWRLLMLHAVAVDEPAVAKRGSVDDPAAGRASAPRSLLVTRIGARSKVAILALTLAVAVAATALVMAITNSEPRIVGPDTIRAGQSVVYRAETPPGAEHYWVDWNGVRHDEDSLRVEPSGAGVLPITLTQVVDGQQRTETLLITVDQ